MGVGWGKVKFSTDVFPEYKAPDTIKTIVFSETPKGDTNKGKVSEVRSYFRERYP